MKKTIVVLWLLLLSTAGSLYAQTDSLFVDGKIYVKIKNNANIVLNDYTGNVNDLRSEMVAFKATYGLTKIYRPFKATQTSFFQNIYQFEFTSITQANNFINDLMAISYVEFAEKVPVIKLSFVPSDPFFSNGNLSPTNWHLKQIGAESAWNINTGSTGVVIAIIDSEIDMNHADINNGTQLWQNTIDNTVNGIDEDGNGIFDDVNGADWADMDGITSPNNILNHGTHCAGIASGVTNNNFGISSIGYNCKLMPIKATSNATAFPGTIDMTAAVNGINYAVTKGARIISCSWGSFSASTPLAVACANAIASNVVIVAAVGNNGANIQLFPAAEPGVIGVAATGVGDVVAPFSNFGTTVDVCAPGVNIFSTNSLQQVTAINGYDYKSGTSMATPLVAGLCGLILTQNSALTPAQVQNCLQNTATNIYGINPTYGTGTLGAGRINAPQAILCAANSLNAFFTGTPLNACPGQTINLTGYSVQTGITSWNWSFSQTPSSISGNGTANVTATFATPGPVTVTLSVVATSGTYTTSVTNYLTIAGPSAAFVSPAAGNICDGSAQELIVNFLNATPPINYTIGNGYSTQTLTAATQSSSFHYVADINYPNYTITSINDANGCLSNPNSATSLNVIHCCANLLKNGNFELDNTLFSSDNTYSCTLPSGTAPFGLYSVTDLNPSVAPNNSCWTMGISGGNNQANSVRNLALTLDTRCGTNETTDILFSPIGFNTPANSPGTTSRLWYEQNVPVTSGHNYNIDYFVASSPGNGNSLPFILRFEVIDQSNNMVLFTSSPSSNGYVSYGDYLWHQFSFTWNCTTTANTTVRLVQVDNFAAVFFDIAVDDISIRRTNVPTGGGGAYAGADATICSGSSIQLSGSGNPTYTWTPSGTLSSSTVAQPTATPTATTTYSLSVNNSCGASSDQVTITVVPAPSAPTTWTVSPSAYLCGPATLTISVATLSGAIINWYSASVGGTPFFSGNTYVTPSLSSSVTYYITYRIGSCESARVPVTITINTAPCCTAPTIVFTGTTITSTAAGSIPSGSIVQVPSNFNFVIDNNPTYTNVTFRLQTNARITVNSLTTSSTVNTLTLNNCKLYRDCGLWEMWDGIYLIHSGSNYGNLTMNNNTRLEDAKKGVQALGNTSTGNNTNVGAVINITDCVFNKNYENIRLTNYTNTGTPYPITIGNTKFMCASSSNSPGSLLTNPYLGLRTNIGIALNNVTNCILGKTITATDKNYFSDMDYGVHATTSGAEIVNNSFSSMAGNVISTVPYGVGVYSLNTSTNTRAIKVGGTATLAPNTFSEIYRAVDVTYVASLEVQNNQMTCLSTPATFTVSGNITSHIAVRGTQISTKFDVQGNTITNFANGIGLRRNLSTATTFNPNTIVQTNTLSVSGSGYVSMGIGVTDVSGNTITTTGPVRIRDNSLSNMRDYGVLCSNIKNRPVVAGTSVGAQTIGMLYQATGTTYGVYIQGCDKANVTNNTISSTNKSNITMIGVNLITSTNSRVSCNTISNIGVCVRAEGTSTSPYNNGTSYQYGIVSNTFTNSNAGISLVNSGYIGKQGDATHPAGNVWTSTATSYTLGQLHAATGTTPDNYYYKNGIGNETPTYLPTAWSGTLVASATGTNVSCPGSATRMAMDDKGTDEPQSNNIINVFPNPNNGQFTISSSETQDFVRIEIFDMQGKRVLARELKNFRTEQIDMSAFNSGMYYIHISGNGVNETRSVVKE